MALGKRQDVLAALGKPLAPLPGQGDHLGDELLLLRRVLDVPEVDAAVPLDPGEEGEEDDV